MSTATFTEASSGVLSSVVGLIGLGVSYQMQTGLPDVVASIVMASIVSCVSVFLLGKSGNALLGQTLPTWRVKSLIETLEAHAAVVNVYDVKTELVGVDTVRFKAEVQFNTQAITERMMEASQERQAPAGGPLQAHGMLAMRLKHLFPQLRSGLREEVAAAWSGMASMSPEMAFPSTCEGSAASPDGFAWCLCREMAQRTKHEGLRRVPRDAEGAR